LIFQFTTPNSLPQAKEISLNGLAANGRQVGRAFGAVHLLKAED
jgi:hypothetical protein